jgi:Chaperone of endosialidase
MRSVRAGLAVLIYLFAHTTVSAQSAQPPARTAVPRVIAITGVFQPADGQPPRAVETATLALYAEPTGGTPLWQETQGVAVDAKGRYSLLLGATSADGIPAAILTAGARWLGTSFERPGEVEGLRVQLTSVPYTLRAADADTLGGRPASAYLLAPTAKGDGTTAATPNGSDPSARAPQVVQPGTANHLAKYVNTDDIGNSAVIESAGRVGIGIAAPLDALHVNFTNTTGQMTGLAVQNLGNTATSYSGMLFYDQNGALGQFQGFNNVTHEYRINNIAQNSGGFDGTINFMIGGSSKFSIGSNGDVTIPGALVKGGVPFLRVLGENTYVGLGAGGIGVGNAAVGYHALNSNTTGLFNVAVGAHSLLGNTQGTYNVAIGTFALETNQTGGSNIAVGAGALEFNSTGSGNVAVGDSALLDASGTNNVGLGFLAGRDLGSGSNNIYLGAQVVGSGGDSNTMYLGAVGTQTRTFIAGVRGITTGAADAVTVMVDSAGQLGTVNSSRRYKEDIQDMGDASSGLMKLRPVTFRYTQPYVDGSKPLDYGLIAEEVEEVYPDLIAHLADGEVETVQYHKINAMLLNEVQKQHRALQSQHQTLEEQRQQLDSQRAEIELLKARLAALEAQRR